MEVFLTTHDPLSPERAYFEDLTIKSLQLNGFNPIIVKKKMLERYFWIDKKARSKIYIVCDNDIILSKPNTLVKLKELMEKHPELSQLGLGWRPDMQAECESAWKIGEIDDDIWEFKSAGGCLAIRKGTIKDLGLKMEFENYGDDRVIGETARRLGYKVGIAHKLLMYHLGSGNEYTTFKQTNIT